MNVKLVRLLRPLVNNIDDHDLVAANKCNVLVANPNLDILDESKRINFNIMIIKLVNKLVVLDIVH